MKPAPHLIAHKGHLLPRQPVLVEEISVDVAKGAHARVPVAAIDSRCVARSDEYRLDDVRKMLCPPMAVDHHLQWSDSKYRV